MTRMKPTATSVTEGIDLSGTTAIVTGSSSGLGRECARVLALRGAKVLLACRNPTKAEAVIRAFADTIGADATKRCVVMPCDTASMRSVHAMTDAVVAGRQSVDFLFLNAGVFGLPYHLTEDGLEYTFAANYVGHFLMVHELARGRSLAAQARIVATMSEGAYRNPFSRLDLEMLAHAPEAERRFSKLSASPNSKVLLALSMAELSRRVQGTSLAGVTFNAGEPGPTKTDNINQGGPVLRFFGRTLGPLFMKSVGEGSAVLLWAATSPDLAGQTGKLFGASFEEIRVPKRFADPRLAEGAWTKTEESLGLPPFEPA